MSRRSAAVLALEGEVLTLLRRARRTAGERARVVHPDLSLTAYGVLVELLERPQGCSQKDLADALGIDKGAVSRAVQQLGDLGLVARSADPADGRARVVRLSEAGAARLAEVRERRRAGYEARFDGWDEAEIEGLADALARYNQALDDSA